MDQTTRELCEETISARVEHLMNQRESNKTPEERWEEKELNERLDRWMREVTTEQKLAMQDCIDDMLSWNGVCQDYIYEEGVKDGIRLMKMIYEL